MYETIRNITITSIVIFIILAFANIANELSQIETTSEVASETTIINWPTCQ